MDPMPSQTPTTWKLQAQHSPAYEPDAQATSSSLEGEMHQTLIEGPHGDSVGVDLQFSCFQQYFWSSLLDLLCEV
jgi:hypothetical protein